MSSLRILVVDDNIDGAQTLALLLRFDEHVVETAFDGESAWKLALEFRPHAVVLDIGLPKLNGYDFAKRIRETPDVAHAVLIAYTGYHREPDRQQALGAG